MNVLVTGGAGYIGSIVVEQLISHGHQAVVYDSLSKGHAQAISPEATFVQGDLDQHEKLVETFDRQKIEAIIHMAASSLVGESVQKPHLYFSNNVLGGHSLLDAMLTAGIKKIVFSSTA